MTEQDAEDAHALRCAWLSHRYRNGYDPNTRERALLQLCERICVNAGLILTNWEPASGEKEEG